MYDLSSALDEWSLLHDSIGPCSCIIWWYFCSFSVLCNVLLVLLSQATDRVLFVGSGIWSSFQGNFVRCFLEQLKKIFMNLLVLCCHCIFDFVLKTSSEHSFSNSSLPVLRRNCFSVTLSATGCKWSSLNLYRDKWFCYSYPLVVCCYQNAIYMNWHRVEVSPLRRQHSVCLFKG